MFSVEQLMIPVWDTEVIYDEALTMVRSNGVCEAPLLFMPLEILKVTSADKTKEYEEGIDYEVEGNIFRLTENSRIFAFEENELIFETEQPNGTTYPTVDGKWSLLQGGHYFHDRQIEVTYKKAKTESEFTVDFCGHLLPKTMKKLQNKEPLKIVLFGDSISEGSNSSGRMMTTPFLPVWGQLLALKLGQHYETTVNLINTAKGGMDSLWAIENASELAGKHKPDLAIIAFGMNDREEADKFAKNLEKIKEIILEDSPETEFILCATTAANPIIRMPGWYIHQDAYRETVLALEEPGTAIADFNSMQKYLMKAKRYIDLTGNNVNHPNDFMARCHAHVIADMLIKRR